jgi:hypothetical protein
VPLAPRNDSPRRSSVLPLRCKLVRAAHGSRRASPFLAHRSAPLCAKHCVRSTAAPRTTIASRSRTLPRFARAALTPRVVPVFASALGSARLVPLSLRPRSAPPHPAIRFSAKPGPSFGGPYIRQGSLPSSVRRARQCMGCALRGALIVSHAHLDHIRDLARHVCSQTAPRDVSRPDRLHMARIDDSYSYRSSSALARSLETTGAAKEAVPRLRLRSFLFHSTRVLGDEAIRYRAGRCEHSGRAKGRCTPARWLARSLAAPGTDWCARPRCAGFWARKGEVRSPISQ